jgi:hypothetical protein
MALPSVFHRETSHQATARLGQRLVRPVAAGLWSAMDDSCKLIITQLVG